MGTYPKRHPRRQSVPSLGPAPPPTVLARAAEPAQAGEPIPPRPEVCGMRLIIGESVYSLSIDPREPGDDACESSVVALKTMSGDVYHVAKVHGIWECTCADFVLRIADTEGVLKGCKHIRALTAKGLLPALGAVRPKPRHRMLRLPAAPKTTRAFDDGLGLEQEAATC